MSAPEYGESVEPEFFTDVLGFEPSPDLLIRDCEVLVAEALPEELVAQSEIVEHKEPHPIDYLAATTTYNVLQQLDEMGAHQALRLIIDYNDGLTIDPRVRMHEIAAVEYDEQQQWAESEEERARLNALSVLTTCADSIARLKIVLGYSTEATPSDIADMFYHAQESIDGARGVLDATVIDSLQLMLDDLKGPAV